MKRLAILAVSSALVLATAGCGSSGSTKASGTTPTTKPPAGSTTTGGDAMTSTTKASSSSGDAGSFCRLLATDTDKTAGFAASIGTPQQAAKLAEVKADNAAVLAAAPSEIHDAVAQVYAVSEKGRAALDPSLSAADRARAGAAVAAAAGTPAVKQAIADYKAWVQANCGSLTSKILSGGL